MNTKVTVKTRIVVDGKEYHSLEELPAALRAAYEKAVASGAQARPTSRIVFNEQTYDTPEAMPADVRQLYEAALANLPKQGAPSPVWPQDVGAAIEPPGGSQRILRGLLIGAALLALLYWMYGR
jgi:hypothetical protein